MSSGAPTAFGPGTVPGQAVNYGTDLSCISDIDPAAVEVSGLTCLGQAIARRLSTPRGTLIDDPSYGYDVTQYVNDDISPADLARIGSGCDAEILKDERVKSSTTKVTFPFGGASEGALVIGVQLTPAVGPSFKLVLGVSAVSVTVLQAAT